jgi:outer membrane protein insertion porin family
LKRHRSFFILPFILSLGLCVVSLRSEAQRPNKKSAPTQKAKSVNSQTGQKITKVGVRGQKRLEVDAILSRVTAKENDLLSPDVVRADILALFESGFFESVEATFDQGVLIYVVQEKPLLASISFEGNKELKADELEEASGFKAFEIFNQARLREALDKMLKLYEDKGFFLLKIDPVITSEDKGDRVNLKFVLTENEKVRVKTIHFIGNQKLSDAYLKSRLATQEEGYFSGISGSGQFKQEAFERDTQILRFLYYNQGYVKAKVDRPTVQLTPDRLGLYITFRVEEGEQYKIGEVDFAGDLLFPVEKLKETSLIDNSEIFAYDLLQKDLNELQALYGDLGYAYANVIPRTRFDDKEKKADLVFEFSKGEIVNFGRISVTGNSKTRDKVLRRELKIREGEQYHETRKRESLENIQRLGFFEEVNFKTSTPLNQPNIMDIEIVVKERNTGQIQIGAGYSTATGLALQGSVQQTNFRGLGQNLGVSLQLSDQFNQYDVNFTEPYYNDTDWSLGFRIFRNETSGRLDYDEDKTGASLFASHPVGEYLRAGVNYTYQASRLKAVKDGNGVTLTDEVLFPIDTASGDASIVGANIEYDTRNDRFRPSKGIYSRLSFSYAGLIGGNLDYYKTGADYRFFKKLFWDVVWRNNFSYAKIDSTVAGRDVPFNELYVLGGPYTLRGYRFSTVGLRKFSQKLKDRFTLPPPTGSGLSDEEATKRANRVFGGEQQFLYQTELMFPLIREAEMYGVGFYDIGAADNNLYEEKFYGDWGFGIRWFSPLGPLRFEWGFPISRDKDYHEASVFEFSIGTPF